MNAFNSSVLVFIVVTAVGCSNTKRKKSKNAQQESNNSRDPVGALSSGSDWNGVVSGGQVNVSKLCRLEAKCMGSDVDDCTAFINQNPITRSEQTLIEKCIERAGRDCEQLKSCLSVSEMAEGDRKSVRKNAKRKNSYAHRDVLGDAKIQSSRIQVDKIASAVMQYTNMKNELPPDLKVLVERKYISNKQTKDPWKNDLTYQPGNSNELDDFTLCSSGEDGSPGTDDDICSEHDDEEQGLPKATRADCQRAADNLTEKGDLLGKVMGETMMEVGGENACEGRFTPAQANCLASLETVDEKSLLGCE